VAALPELARVPSDLVTLTLRAAAFPLAVLAELRRLNTTLAEVALIRKDLGPNLEHLPNLAALQGIRTSLDRLSQPGGALDRIADISATLDRLAELDDSLKQLGKLDESLQDIAALTEAVGGLSKLQPTLDLLNAQMVDMQRSMTGLGDALLPIGKLAGRWPGGNRRAR
jgi:hypothetical protein